MRHDGGPTIPAAATVVATWPKGSFAENLAVDAAGFVFVTLHTDRAIVKVDPRSGRTEPFATFATPVAGLAFAFDGSLVVSGGTPGHAGGVLWRAAPDGAVTRIADLPDAPFLNGVTPLPGDRRFIVADSLLGALYLVDVEAGTAELWFADPRLAPPERNGTPGANGVKFFGRHLTVSNTGADRLYRMALDDERPGPLELVAESLRADDFAFGIDGSLFIATHPAHSLVRLGSDGARTTLAAADHGLTGATAVAFGRRPEDAETVYVTTTGGTGLLPPERLEDAKLVRVSVGVAGAPIAEASA